MADVKTTDEADGAPAQASDIIRAARGAGNVRLTAQSIAALAAGGPAVPSDFQAPILDDYYYFSQLIVPSSGDVLEYDSLVAYPFWVSEETTWTRIGVDCVTGSGSPTEKIRLGIWANGADNRPGALLLDSGELSLENEAELEATISEVIPANTLVWIGHNSNDSGSLAEVRRAVLTRYDTFAWLLGAQSVAQAVSANQNEYMGVYRGLAYGPLPDPFGTPDDLISNVAAIWLRKV